MSHSKHRMRRPSNVKTHLPAATRIFKAISTPQYKEACRIRSSQRWQDLRAMVLRRFPLCACGCERPAEDVHHIRGVTQYPELAFTVTNLLPLSDECHNGIESAEKRGITIDMLIDEENFLNESDFEVF